MGKPFGVLSLIFFVLMRGSLGELVGSATNVGSLFLRTLSDTGFGLPGVACAVDLL